MLPKIKQNLEAISEICKQFKVAELYLFGSAIRPSFRPESSDLDFAVLFVPNIPVEDMADHYFGLIEALEKLLQSPVDLVTLKSVKNPIFKKELEETMVPLYAA